MKSHAPSLRDAISECINNPEFVKEYRRLTGHSLERGNPLDFMIDEATGKLDDEANQLFDFIRDYVWLPVTISVSGSV